MGWFLYDRDLWHKRVNIIEIWEVVVLRCSAKKLFLKNPKNSHEIPCQGLQLYLKGDLKTQVFFCQFHEMFKNTFLYRTSPLAVSDM